MEKLQIRKGGKLVKTYWDYDKTIKKGSFKDIDVTSSAISRLFEICDLEEGVTLRDIFTLINTELEIFDSVVGNWTKDIVTEGLTAPPTNNDFIKDVEYLELYWGLHKDKEFKTNEPIVYGQHRSDFHGVGFVQPEDKFDNWGTLECKKGERINYGMSLTGTNDVIDLPVKLNKNLLVYEDTGPLINPNGVTNLGKTEFTLGNILYDIIWEFSFHGGPQSREKQSKELHDRVKEIEDDTAELISIDDLFADLKKDSNDL